MVMIYRRGTLPGLGGLPLERIAARLETRSATLPLTRIAERLAAAPSSAPQLSPRPTRKRV